MRRDLAITALSATASATLFLSLTAGVLGAPAFAYFVQLPLLFLGLSIGAASATLAGAGALGVVLVFGGSVAAAIFLVVQVGPSLLAVRQALLHRPGDAGGVEWYPTGAVVGQLVLYTAVVMVLSLAIVRYVTGDIESTFLAAIRELARDFDATGGQSAALAAGIAEYGALVPGLVAVSWGSMTIGNRGGDRLVGKISF